MDKFNELYLLNDDIKLDIPNDIEDYSYNEIRSYIKEANKELSNLLNLYFLNDERNYFFWEAIDNANLNSFDTIKKWVKSEGLDKFCKEEKINKNNINIDSAMDYFNILLSDKIEGFLDDFKATYRYELKKDIADYVHRELDKFINYFLSDVLELRDKKYNELKNIFDWNTPEDKANNYIRDVMDKGIDYQKLEGKLKNRIIRRMAKMRLI